MLKPATFSESYFTDLYNPETHTCLRVHSNKIVLVTMASGHPFLQEHKPGLDFKVDFEANKTNLLKQTVKGKKKKGGVFAQAHYPVARILVPSKTESDEEDPDKQQKEYPILAGFRGWLTEVNDNLIKSPQLLVEQPRKAGYIAILIPKIAEIKKIMANPAAEIANYGLVLKSDYEKALLGSNSANLSCDNRKIRADSHVGTDSNEISGHGLGYRKKA